MSTKKSQFVFSIFFLLCACSKQKAEYHLTKLLDGGIMRVRTRDGLANGRSIGYDKNGNIKFIINMVQGYSQGVSYAFYENGDIWKIDHYSNGLLNGKCYTFYKKNKVQCISNYSRDTLNGLSKCFYYSGGIKSRINYRSGNPSDHCLYYYEQPENRVKRNVQYKIINNKSWQNWYVDYDINGNEISGQNKLVANLGKSINGRHEFKLSIKYPTLKYAKFNLFNYASCSTDDTTKSAVFYEKNKTIKFYSECTSVKQLKGYVTVYDSLITNKKTRLYYTKERRIYL